MIIQGNVVAGHIDASCAVDPSCEAMVLQIVQTLPAIALPLMYTAGRVVHGIVVYACSAHPDGGQNKGITARID